MLNSIIEKLKDKTVVMAILGYVMSIVTALGVNVNSVTITTIVVSLCSILTILGIMHDSGSSNVTPIQTSENKVEEEVKTEDSNSTENK
jgi:uncharacterized membrane protein